MEEKKKLNEIVSYNISKILQDRNLNQIDIATETGMSASNMNKKLKGQLRFSLDEISKIAKALSIREIDIITYPDVYVKKEESTSDPVEAILQIKLQRDKKDQVLKLIFGDNDIEILNK